MARAECESGRCAGSGCAVMDCQTTPRSLRNSAIGVVRIGPDLWPPFDGAAADSRPQAISPERHRPSSHSGSYSRSEEHTSELQSRSDLVCRLLLEKKKKNRKYQTSELPHSHLTGPLADHEAPLRRHQECTPPHTVRGLHRLLPVVSHTTHSTGSSD